MCFICLQLKTFIFKNKVLHYSKIMILCFSSCFIYFNVYKKTLFKLLVFLFTSLLIIFKATLLKLTIFFLYELKLMRDF